MESLSFLGLNQEQQSPLETSWNFLVPPPSAQIFILKLEEVLPLSYSSISISQEITPQLYTVRTPIQLRFEMKFYMNLETCFHSFSLYLRVISQYKEHQQNRRIGDEKEVLKGRKGINMMKKTVFFTLLYILKPRCGYQ